MSVQELDPSPTPVDVASYRLAFLESSFSVFYINTEGISPFVFLERDGVCVKTGISQLMFLLIHQTQ
jgi:hypothetical protein